MDIFCTEILEEELIEYLVNIPYLPGELALKYELVPATATAQHIDDRNNVKWHSLLNKENENIQYVERIIFIFVFVQLNNCK